MKKEEAQETRVISIYSILLLISYAMIITAFLFLLNKQQNTGFGVSEIIFSIIAALLLTSMFIVAKLLMRANACLGLAFGLVFILSLLYALFTRFTGPYTTTFAVIGSLVALIYMGIYFFKYRTLSKELVKN